MTAAPQSFQPKDTELRQHSPLPWAYRPQKHDDWGWIRDADGDLAATARNGSVLSSQFDEYRIAGTDPYGPNAAFIVEAVNSHTRLTERCEQYKGQVKAGSDEIDALKAKLAEWKQAASVEAGLRREFAERIQELEGALRFYADPFEWKKQHDPENVVRVPDFYSETSFGDTAEAALSPDGNRGVGK